MIAVIPLNDSNTIIWDFMSKLDLKSEYLLSALEQLTFQEKNNFSDNVISALREKKDTNLYASIFLTPTPYYIISHIK